MVLNKKSFSHRGGRKLRNTNNKKLKGFELHGRMRSVLAGKVEVTYKRNLTAFH